MVGPSVGGGVGGVWGRVVAVGGRVRPGGAVWRTHTAVYRAVRVTLRVRVRVTVRVTVRVKFFCPTQQTFVQNQTWLDS